MAQLLVKKSSWWEFSTKQALIWVPVAAVQASTLAGLGYFYHRLNVLEAQSMRQPVLANALQDVTAPTTRLNRIPPPPPPAPVSASWQVALDSPVASGARVLGTGKVFRRDGTLVATVVQQGLARLLEQKREGKI